MSELNRVLDDRLETFRPREVPPFARITARYARRRRARTAGALVLSTVMLASLAVLGSSLVQQHRGRDSLARSDERGAASVGEVRGVLCPFADRSLDTQAERVAVFAELDAALGRIGAFTPEALDVYEPAVRMVNVHVAGSGATDTTIPVPGVTPEQPQPPPASTDEISSRIAEEARQEMLAAQADLKTACE